MRIDEIKLTCMRGATGTTTLHFDSSKRIALIFGENGSGKSSIVDAIDLVCNESIGSLEDRSLDGTTRGSHLKSIGKQPKDLAVEMKSGAECWQGCLDRNLPKVTGPSPRPVAHILRRTKLVKFTEATAGEKYKQVAPFIAVEGVEASEIALGKAIATITNSQNLELRTQRDAEGVLSGIWTDLGCPGSPNEGFLAWAARQMAHDVTTTARKAEVLRLVSSSLANLVRCSSEYLEAKGVLADLDRQIGEMTQQAYSSDGGALARQASLLKVLFEAAIFLRTYDDASECPVCELPQDTSALLSAVKRRGKEIADGNALHAKMAELSEKRRVADGILSGTALRLAKSASNAVRDLRLNETTVKDESSLAKRFRLLESPDEQQLADCVALAAAAPPLAERIHSQAETLEGELELANVLRHNLALLEGAKARALDFQHKSDRLSAIARIIREERITFTQAILDEVHEDCSRIYGQLHPGEIVSSEALTLDSTKRASVRHSARFGDHSNVPAAAYFSESHIDTLGLALFIAIAKRQGGKEAVLVLDDVFSSVDGPHMDRIMNVLAEESKHFAQVIVTTHFRRMFDSFRLNKGHLTQLMQLSEWSMNSGINVHQSKMELALLKGFLTEPVLDRQSVASKAGYILDSALDYLVLNYQCSTPKVPGGANSLYDLYVGFKKVASHLRVQRGEGKGDGWTAQGPEITIGPLFDKMEKDNLIRNTVGAHYNIDGFSVTEAELRGFAERVVELVTALICPECQCLPTRRKESYWECACGACRTTPLGRPEKAKAAVTIEDVAAPDGVI